MDTCLGGCKEFQIIVKLKVPNRDIMKMEIIGTKSKFIHEHKKITNQCCKQPWPCTVKIKVRYIGEIWTKNYKLCISGCNQYSGKIKNDQCHHYKDEEESLLKGNGMDTNCHSNKILNCVN